LDAYEGTPMRIDLPAISISLGLFVERDRYVRP
jgi:hypothetical protein